MAKKKKTDDKPMRTQADQQFKNVARVVAMGKVFAEGDKKKENDWAVRMMKAGLTDMGLIMPEDWNTLSEDEKSRRIEGVMKILNE